MKIVRISRANIHWIYILWFLLTSADCRRYRYCSEGCCPEEYCAYHTICYPKMHCTHGCPDGDCQKELCMPTRPCSSTSQCKIAHICTMNFNLGYNTCQYNLDIGKTLCVDRDGQPRSKTDFTLSTVLQHIFTFKGTLRDCYRQMKNI